jgi:hypothetical protein
MKKRIVGITRRWSTKQSLARLTVVLATIPFALGFVGCSPSTTSETEYTAEDGTRYVRVILSGGHETNPADRGRPVILVAGALGVPPEVFRDAFSRVRPAPGGSHPTRERARENKRVLMTALGRYGVTNDRLDTVSNYYRYRPQRGEMWPVRKAKINALIKDGDVTGFQIRDGGAGYSSPPVVIVPGYGTLVVDVQLSFSHKLEHNGSISAISFR